MTERLEKIMKWLLFAICMLFATAAIILFVGKNVVRIQEAERLQANELKNSIIQEINDGLDVENLASASCVNGAEVWIQLTKENQTYIVSQLETQPSDQFLHRISTEHSNYRQTVIGDEYTYSISNTIPSGIYIGVVHSEFEKGNLAYELMLVAPQTIWWQIVLNDIPMYAALWLVAMVLAYFLSNMLSKKVIKYVGKNTKNL